MFRDEFLVKKKWYLMNTWSLLFSAKTRTKKSSSQNIFVTDFLHLLIMLNQIANSGFFGVRSLKKSVFALYFRPPYQVLHRHYLYPVFLILLKRSAIFRNFLELNFWVSSVFLKNTFDERWAFTAVINHTRPLIKQSRQNRSFGGRQSPHSHAYAGIQNLRNLL